MDNDFYLATGIFIICIFVLYWAAKGFVKSTNLLEKKNQKECVYCGKIFESNECYWINPEENLACIACVEESFSILKQVFNAPNFEEAKKIISDFDENFDDSFLDEDIEVETDAKVN
jgi:hypothetical protein